MLGSSQDHLPFSVSAPRPSPLCLQPFSSTQGVRQSACKLSTQFKTPSFSWVGAAWGTPGLIWAINQFCPDSIIKHLPASCVRGRIAPQLEPDMRPMMPTHSLHILLHAHVVQAGAARPGEITQPTWTLTYLAKIRLKQSQIHSEHGSYIHGLQ